MDIIDIYEAIMLELGNFYFKRTSLSYRYLIDAIYIVVINDKKVIRDFNDNVYPQIAERYNTKPQNVMWNITKLLKVMYLNTDMEIIQDYFGISYEGNPSPKAFIILVSYKVQIKIDTENVNAGKDLQYFL